LISFAHPLIGPAFPLGLLCGVSKETSVLFLAASDGRRGWPSGAAPMASSDRL
jgi:hypothetical protein